jgi:hypothetical protein
MTGRNALRAVGPVAALAGALVLIAAGQGLAAEPRYAGDPRLRDTRVAASVPNISGVWMPQDPTPRMLPVEGGDPPWLPWAEAVFRDRAQKEAEGTPMWDPTAACYGSGIPRVLSIDYPHEIVQTPDAILWMSESQHVFRIIHMGAAHPANFKPTMMGHSIGRWDGDVLVVDTVGISGRGQIDQRGTPQSEEMRVVERIQRMGDALEYLITIDDPGAYAKPWTVRKLFKFGVEDRLAEYVCEENNRNTPGADGFITTSVAEEQ